MAGGGITGAGGDPRVTMPPSLASAYTAETVALLRARVAVSVALFVLWIAIAAGFECTHYPERVSQVLVVCLFELVACGVAVGLVLLEHWVFSPVVVATVLGMALGIAGNAYSAWVGAGAEQLVMAQGLFLSALALVLPWNWRPQLWVSATTCATFWLAARYLHVDRSLAYPALVLGSAAAGSVAGAWYLDRYRRDAFVSEASHREDREVAQALLHVGETLAHERDQDAILARLNELAVETLQCDWSHTYIWDPVRRRQRLAASAGVPPEVRADIEQFAFPLDRPSRARDATDEVIEIPDVAAQKFVPCALMLRFQCASSLVTRIVRGDEVIGVLAHGYRERTGPFSQKQRRLAVGLSHAVTIALENVRLIADLKTASAFKTEFVATLSHELRTPLNVVLGFADMLADGAFGELTRAQQNALGRVRMGAREVLDMVEETLDLGRIDAGRESVTRTPVDLDGLFREVAREFEALVPEGVALKWHNAVGRRAVVGDRVKLKTILKNLVGNALKFTESGTVEVTAQAPGRKLRLAVKDTGIGIAESDLPVIFEMFRQVDGAEKRGTGGVGLGLHIVQRLVGVLGGEIAVKSAPGEGSTFTITLPLAEQSTGT